MKSMYINDVEAKYMECELQEKRMTVIWVSQPQEDQRELGIRPISSYDRNGGNYRRMNSVEKFCRVERGLLLLSVFAENKSEGQKLEL